MASFDISEKAEKKTSKVKCEKKMNRIESASHVVTFFFFFFLFFFFLAQCFPLVVLELTKLEPDGYDPVVD